MSKRLILHVGLPKTGTSALQYWLDANRASLRQQGVIYPKSDGTTKEPKHQFLVNGLLSGRLKSTKKLLEATTSGTLVLSAEGLTNHFYDFDAAALATFRHMIRHFSVVVILVVREPHRWIKSYYKQALLNPPNQNYLYGTDLTLDEFRNQPRVQRLCSIEKLKEDLCSSFGSNEAIVVKYEEDFLGAFCNAVGIDPLRDFSQLQQSNTSVPDELMELIRQINAMALPKNERAKIMAALQACVGGDNIILKHSYASAADPNRIAWAFVERLKPLTQPQQAIVDDLKLFFRDSAVR